MDMIAGAVIAVASILLVRRLRALRSDADEPAIPTVGQLAQSPA
jgi:hypothetical protein